MNRLSIAIIAASVCISTGCSTAPDHPSEDAQNNSTAPSITDSGESLIQRNELDNSETPDNATPTRSSVESPEQFGKLIATLTEKAQRLEAQMKHAEAAKIWNELAERLASTFGPDAWQTQNAKFSRELASRAANLSAEQSRQFQQVIQLNRQTRQSVADNELNNAIEAAVRSRELLMQIIPDADVTIARQSLEIAMLQSTLGDHSAAVENYQSAIRRFQRSQVLLHPDLERAHAGLATAALAAGNVPQALANQKEATRIAGSLWGDRSVDYALQANQLGVLYHRSGELSTALKILRASEVIRRNHLGPDDPQVGHSRFNIGVVLMDMKQYDEALDNFKQAEQILLATSRPDWKAVSECQSKMATIYMLGGHFVPAQAMLQSALTNLKQSASYAPEEVNALQYRLAIALAKQGKYDRARPMLEQLVDFQKRTLGDHPDTLKSLQALALVMQQTRQTDAAERLSSEARRMAEALPDTTKFRR